MTTKTEVETKFAALPVARNLWLAGLGVYGAAFDEAVKRSEGSRKRVEELFDTFITKGTEVEGQTRDAVSKARDEVTKARETANLNIEGQVEKFRASFKFPFVPTVTRVQELEDEVAALTKKVNTLTRAPRADKAPKTAVKKAA